MKQLHFEQVSVLTAPYLHHTLEYALDSIAANGFHGVELWGASPHFCIDDYTPEERAARIRDIRQMLKDRDLRLTAFQPEHHPLPMCGSAACSLWSGIWRIRWIWVQTG